MFRWISLIVGGLVVLRVAYNAWVQTYQARPFSTVLGTALVLVVVAVAAAALHAESEPAPVRRASEEYGPRYRPPGDGAPYVVEHLVRHVVQHRVEVVHTHRFEGSAWQQPRPPRGTGVVEGEVVRREIEDGSGRG